MGAERATVVPLPPRRLYFRRSPDLEVFEALGVHLVQEEVRQLLPQLVEAEEETLHVAELQFGLLVGRVLSVLHLVWGEGHELLPKHQKSPPSVSCPRPCDTHAISLMTRDAGSHQQLREQHVEVGLQLFHVSTERTHLSQQLQNLVDDKRTNFTPPSTLAKVRRSQVKLESTWC